MKQSIKANTPEVLKEVLCGAKHIDALDVLQKDIDFLQSLSQAFGSTPTKEENAVLAKYKNILDNKCAYLGQLIRETGVNLKGYGKLPFDIDFAHWSSIKKDLNITVVISPVEEA
tara:strand:+ start:1320 stop:1664 length:345 start_codon:yes stop_codon:yes gene_type:complete